jgi:hypothetical protein
MVAALMAPALWNGFPLIFPDTSGYLDRAMLGTLGLGRSALYGLFLYAGVPFSFWPNALLQSALSVWLIVLTLRTNGLGGRPWLALSVVAMLTVGTSLPLVHRPVDARHSVSRRRAGALSAGVSPRPARAVGAHCARRSDRLRHSQPHGRRRRRALPGVEPRHHRQLRIYAGRLSLPIRKAG